MIVRVNLALIEAENARRTAERAARPALHPLAEFYGDWERAKNGKADPERAYTFSMTGDDD